MSEAPLEKKVEMLKVFNAAASGGYWLPTAQEKEWFIDMQKDGLIEAQSGYFPQSTPKVGVIEFYQPPPNGFCDIQVTEKGKKLIDDFDSERTCRGLWKRHRVSILKWIFGIVAAVIGAILLRFYTH